MIVSKNPLHYSSPHVISGLYNISGLRFLQESNRLNRGQEYQSARPAIHIGFLDYTLFSKCPEFYACYKLINLKNYQIYSDNLTLYVADLSRIDLATDEDRKFHIDKWARLFKTTTWEEIKMIAANDDALYEAQIRQLRSEIARLKGQKKAAPPGRPSH